MRRLMTALATLAILLNTANGHAGCGCDKPPPAPSQVLPHVTYGGMAVRLLNPSFAAGQTYDVTFTSGTTGAAATVTGTVQVRRDLADAVSKPQLVVTLPNLPLGPASITIRNPADGALVSLIDDSQLTVAPTPVALPTEYGTWTYSDFEAAVGRDGTAYVAFDLSGLQNPMIFEAQAKGYALRFGGEDVVFYNVQGITMQLLTQGSEPVPGMFVFPAGATSADSDLLHYSRHEFSTYFLQHAERLPHAVDASDPNWHLDGSRHVDHDHLILAIAGTIGGAAPKAGATPAFSLSLGAHSLFHDGIVGVSSLSLGGTAVVDSYQPGTFDFGSAGDVLSGGKVTVSNGATVNGSVTGTSLRINRNATVSGGKYLLTSTLSPMSIKVPLGIPDLGAIDLRGGVRTIHGPGSFAVSGITLTNLAALVIDNLAGPVTFYVTGQISLDAYSSITVLNPDPEQFAVYVKGNYKVALQGHETSSFYGVLYAPESTVSIANGSQFYGAIVGSKVSASGRVHYDSKLRSVSAATQTTAATTTKTSSGKTSTKTTTTAKSSAK